MESACAQTSSAINDEKEEIRKKRTKEQNLENNLKTINFIAPVKLVEKLDTYLL